MTVVSVNTLKSHPVFPTITQNLTSSRIFRLPSTPTTHPPGHTGKSISNIDNHLVHNTTSNHPSRHHQAPIAFAWGPFEPAGSVVAVGCSRGTLWKLPSVLKVYVWMLFPRVPKDCSVLCQKRGHLEMNWVVTKSVMHIKFTKITLTSVSS